MAFHWGVIWDVVDKYGSRVVPCGTPVFKLWRIMENIEVLKNVAAYHSNDQQYKAE